MNVSASIRLERGDEIAADYRRAFVAIGSTFDVAIHASRPEEFERLAHACEMAAALLQRRIDAEGRSNAAEVSA